MDLLKNINMLFIICLANLVIIEDVFESGGVYYVHSFHFETIEGNQLPHCLVMSLSSL